MTSGNLSTEYWNLHRNSLLFSSALFVACLATKESNFTIFGLQFGGLGIGAVAFILAIASTYAIIALYLEWKEELRSIYRRVREEYVTTIEETCSYNKMIYEFIEKREYSLQLLENIDIRFFSLREYFQHELTDSIKNKISAIISDIDFEKFNDRQNYDSFFIKKIISDALMESFSRIYIKKYYRSIFIFSS